MAQEVTPLALSSASARHRVDAVPSGVSPSPSGCWCQIHGRVGSLCQLPGCSRGCCWERTPPDTFPPRLLPPFSHSSTMVFCAAFPRVCSSPDFCGTSKAFLPSAHEIIPSSEQSGSEEAFVDSQPPRALLCSTISAPAFHKTHETPWVQEMCQGAAALLGSVRRS